MPGAEKVIGSVQEPHKPVATETKSTEYAPPVAPAETKSSEPVTTPAVTEEKSVETPEVIQTDSPKSITENFKNIRKSLNETKTKLQEREEALAKAQATLDKYEKGEELPPSAKELKDKVEKLSHYQQIVELETSDEFQNTYVKPLTTIQTKLTNIAKDYEIPENVIDQMLGMESQRELNSFLSDHFDNVGAMEVKSLINETNELRRQAEAAKKAPKEALNRLVEEAQVAKITTFKRQVEQIHSKATGAWERSLTRLRASGTTPELTYKDNDSEHNEKIVKPLVETAAKEYGKMVTKLVESGLTKLPDDLSDAMANMCLLAHASAVSISQRNEAIRRYNEVDRNSRRETSYSRPPIGGTFGTGTPPAQAKLAPTVEEGARAILNNVLANRRR